jgi:hypothetical protein
MSKGIVFALRVAGIALIDCGFNAPNPPNSEVFPAFTGALTDKIFRLSLGGSASVVGTVMLFQCSSRFE